MSRFLAIIDTLRLQNLINTANIYVGAHELSVLTKPLPETDNYIDLLKENTVYPENYESKVFLIITLKDEREYSSGLFVSISEIEYLVALDNIAQDKLSQSWTAFHFEALPDNFLEKNQYEKFIIQKDAKLGSAAAAVLLGTVRPPEILSEEELMKIALPISDGILTGRMLTNHKTPWWHTGLEDRSLMGLVTSYRRNKEFNYPKTDIGYCYDIAEIFHYLINRTDVTSPINNKGNFSKEILRELEELYQKAPEDEIQDQMEALYHKPHYQKVINVINNLSHGNAQPIFFYFKAVDIIRNKGWQQNAISDLASWFSTPEERLEFASIIGASVGHKVLGTALYKFLVLDIIRDCEDPNTCIANDTENFPDGELKDDNFLQVENTDSNEIDASVDEKAEETSNEEELPALANSDGEDNDSGLPPVFSEADIFTSFIDNEQNLVANNPGTEAEIISLNQNTVKNNESDLPVEPVTNQKRIRNYRLTNLDAFKQLLDENKNFMVIDDNAINNCISLIIETEAPIKKELIVARLKLVCRRSKVSFRKDKELARTENLISEIIKNEQLRTDKEGFIYAPKRLAFVRSRKDSQNDETVMNSLKQAKNISVAEILAAFYILKKGIGTLGIDNCTPLDIMEILGLPTKGSGVDESFARIKDVIDCYQSDLEKFFEKKESAKKTQEKVIPNNTYATSASITDIIAARKIK